MTIVKFSYSGKEEESNEIRYKKEKKGKREILRIAFYHLESLPRMKYNNQIITNRYLSLFEQKPKIINKTRMDRRTRDDGKPKRKS